MSKLKLIQTYRESDNLVDWLQRFVGTVAEIENWREIGSTGNPGFENSWVNFDSTTYETAAFYKDPFGVVRIKGYVRAGTYNATIFTLPEDYRPPLTLLRTAEEAATSNIKLQVQTDGVVKTAGATSNLGLTISCSFRV